MKGVITMSYDENFYAKYDQYLKEPAVRHNHDYMFSIFASILLPDSPRVIDLGCGVGEYATYDQLHTAYVGIDLNKNSLVIPFIHTNYLKLNFREILPFLPNAFASLFSVECCNPVEKNMLFMIVF